MINKLFPRWKFEKVWHSEDSFIIRAHRRVFLFIYDHEFSRSTLEDAIREAKYFDACEIEKEAREARIPKNEIVGVL